MSAYNIKWIWDQQITAVQKLVLFALNEHCNPAHGDWRCYPSQQTLAKLTNLSDRTIRMNMIELERAGVIRVAHQFDGQGRQRSNMYWLNAPFIGVEADSTRDAADSPSGVKEIPGGRGKEIPTNPLIDKRLNKNTSGDEYAADFNTFWAEWPGRDPKGSKAEAHKVWVKLKGRPSVEVLLKAAQEQVAEKEVKQASGEFVAPFKHVVRWLKGHEWENESTLINLSDFKKCGAGAWR